MYSKPASDIFTLIVMIVIFIAIVSFCCSTNNSSNHPQTKRNTSTNYGSSNSECPAYGAPHYNGYCEKCNYPDINQGWLGENF